MYNKKQLKYIKALTPIHAGTGQGLGTVDMPIQRERHSNIPKIEASSLKGSIKHWIYQKLNLCEFKEEIFEEMLGPKDGEERASRLGFTDARLLFFPIKSDENIFKLITCPYILNRWKEDLIFANCIEKDFTVCNILDGNCITNNEQGSKIFLEEYIFENVQKSIDNDIIDLILANIKSKDIDEKRIVIVNDSEFIDLVTMYTEIVTRNRIDLEKGTTIKGGLFTEEYLPAETIMYFTVLGSPEFKTNNENSIVIEKDGQDAIKYLNDSLDEIFQVGGDATIGKGFVKIIGGKEIEKQ